MLIIALTLTIFLTLSFLPLAIEELFSTDDLADMGVRLEHS